jgi:hypothetical protein
MQACKLDLCKDFLAPVLYDGSLACILENRAQKRMPVLRVKVLEVMEL